MKNFNRYEEAKAFVINKLKDGLAPTLYYHSVDHVEDVLEAAQRIAAAEKMDEEQIELIKIAAIFHDSGFIIQQQDHEKIGCDIAREILPLFNYSSEEIEIVCGMILATHYPHQPKNKLEEIICDADLDYLGRDDFYQIGKLLYKELITNGSIGNEMQWNIMQEKFLKSHRYFTTTSNMLRNNNKEIRLKEITEVVAQYNM
jgi:HD superfamily phosphodiesterase